MIHRCSSSKHHADCDGYVNTGKHAYSVRKFGGKEYYYRYICSMKTTKELVPISVEACYWLRSALREHFDLDKNEWAREIYLTLDDNR